MQSVPREPAIHDLARGGDDEPHDLDREACLGFDFLIWAFGCQSCAVPVGEAACCEGGEE